MQQVPVSTQNSSVPEDTANAESDGGDVAPPQHNELYIKPVNGIVQPPFMPSPSQPGRFTNKLNFLKTVMKAIWIHKKAWPFHQPVNSIKLDLPDYYDVIKMPMDLGTIRKRLENNYYWCADECVQDFNTMFKNCYTYNKPDEKIVSMAKTLEKIFLTQMAQMVKEEETELPLQKSGLKILKTHPIIEKPSPSQTQPIDVAPGSTTIDTTPQSEHNSLPAQSADTKMSADTEVFDHDVKNDNEVFETLGKIIEAVNNEEKELKISMEKKLNEIEKEEKESNGFANIQNEDKELKPENKVEVEIDEVTTVKVDHKKEIDEVTTVKVDDHKKEIDEENNHNECKDSQSNSEDGKEELELSEMIVCDEVAGDSDEDDNKMDTEAIITNDKNKHEKDTRKMKKESKEKESNKKKYDKKSDTKSKDYSRKEDSKRSDKKRSRTPSKDRSSKDSSLKKRSKTIDKEKESKKLRELDKFWQTVRDDPSDFIGWTYLLQYVEGAKNIEAAREAYDAFLDLYPYCYGYWRKYADYERKNGTKENCEKVFDRGLKAIPLSVDLWIHYMGYMKSSYPDDEDMIREQFEKAVDACGIEFRSDRLWDHYIKFELECKQYSRVTNIYERLIATPTHGYLNNFECFKDYVKKYPKNKILETVKFLELRKEVLAEIKEADAKKNHGRKIDSGSDSDDMADPMEQRTKEENLMKEKMIASRLAMHKTTAEMVALRLPYEEMIKRPYFHVKPLERSQIRNWKEYLEFEIGQGIYKRIVALFERCLIACALYEEFWTKYVSYLESLESVNQEIKDRIEDIYIRACTVHHKNKPCINLTWALHLENNGQYDKAAQILDMLDSVAPHKKLIIQRRINLERRRSCNDRVCELYEHYISTANSSLISTLLTVKYARFVWNILKDTNKASKILWTEVEKVNNVQKSCRLLLQIIEIKMSDDPMNTDAIVEVIDKILSMKSIEIEEQVIFAQRKVEYLEEFGKDINLINKATAELNKFMRTYNGHEKKSIDGTDSTSSGKT